MTRYSDALAPSSWPTCSRRRRWRTCSARSLRPRGLTQLRMAETEKYPHVTYFLNGGREEPIPGRGTHPRPLAQGRDLRPAAGDVRGRARQAAIAAIASGRYDLIVLNFANPDMVGHTGVLAAAIKAVETVDARPRPHRGSRDGGRRRAAGHRRPRQLRADAGPRDRRPAHRPHHQPRCRCCWLDALAGWRCTTAASRTWPRRC